MLTTLDGLGDAVDRDDPLEEVIAFAAESATAATPFGGTSAMGTVFTVARTGCRSGAMGLTATGLSSFFRGLRRGDFVFFFHGPFSLELESAFTRGVS